MGRILNSIAGIFLILCVAIASIWTYRTFFEPEPQVRTQTEIVWMDRPLLQVDTTGASVARERAYFESEDESTTELPMFVPDRFLAERDDGRFEMDMVAIDGTSVHVGPSEVRIYGWDFGKETNVRQTYEVPEYTWDYGLNLRGSYIEPGVSAIGIFPYVSYDDLKVEVGPVLNPVSGHFGIGFNVEYRLYNR